MKEKLPVSIALAALGGALVLGFWMRFTVGRPTDSEPPQSVTAAPASGRSVRVEERLQMLRESYAQRQRAEAAKAAGAEASSTRAPAGGTPSAPSAEQERGKRRDVRAGWYTHNAAGGATPKAAQPAPAHAAAHKAPKLSHGFYHPPYMDKKTSFDELQETIVHGTDTQARLDALNELALKEPEDALPIMTIALLEENLDPEISVAVLEALGDFTDDISAEMITPALRNPDPRVRFEAVALLGDMDTAAARDAVRGAVNDQDPEVRELAGGILEISG